MSITRGTLLVISLFTVLFLAGYTAEGPNASTPPISGAATGPMASSESSADATAVLHDFGVCSQADADSPTTELSPLTARPGTSMQTEGSSASALLCGGKPCGGGKYCCCGISGCTCIKNKGGCGAF